MERRLLRLRTFGLVSAVIAVSLVLVLAANVAGISAQGGDEESEYTYEGEVRAPDFPDGLDWLNVTEPLALRDLRGKIVLLDFWTYGCINCIHVIPDLKRLEAEYPDELVVIGVHSAKFENEGDTENIRNIVRRYELEHPVVNDNEFEIWSSYGVNAWPTFWLIDPFGKAVGYIAGEGVYDRLQPIIDVMVQEYTAADVIDRAPIEAIQPELVTYEHDDPLRFPGKVLADPANNRLFIADSNHNRIVVTTLDDAASGVEVLAIIGEGSSGLTDGSFETAQFFRPQGMTLVGSKLYVADTENHAIRQVDLETRTVITVAGTGEQGFNRTNPGAGALMALNSPWDLVAVNGRIYIAMAGPHQLWVYDIETGEVGPYAGSGREALIDGPLMEAAMNQPSGIDTDGQVLYFADAEASAVRTADLADDGTVQTIVGTGLFDFGDRDGVGDEVLLQHVLGITVTDDGLLYVADTYNNKIKRIDPETRASVTFAGTGEPGAADGALDEAAFYEPGGIDYAEGLLYVADTNNHAVRVIDIASGTVRTLTFANPERLVMASDDAAAADADADAASDGLQDAEGALGGSNFGVDVVTLAPATVGAGEGTIAIDVTMPDGYKLNALAPFTAIWPDDAVAQIPDDARDIRVLLPELPVIVPVTFNAGQTELRLDLTVYWCEAINETLCFVDRSEIVLPLTVLPDAEGSEVVFTRELVPPVINDGS